MFDRIRDQSQKCIMFVGSNGSSSGGDWTAWTVPYEAHYVSIWLLGSGAGGGGGYTAASSSAKGGGAGGGSGGTCSAFFLAQMLPQTIYIYLHGGGQGGAAGTAGNPGFSTVIAAVPYSATDASELIMASGITAAAGGAAGKSSGTSTAGAGETSLTTSYANYFCGLSAAIGSVNLYGAGVAGGTGASGTSTTGSSAYFRPNTSITIASGGGGGGGVTSGNSPGQGGFVESGGNELNALWINSYQIIGQAATSASGCSGHSNIDFFSGGRGPAISWYSLGGSGGSGNASGTGGSGGSGAYGAGGGGGGAGTTGGAGGNGGPGLCLISWW